MRSWEDGHKGSVRNGFTWGYQNLRKDMYPEFCFPRKFSSLEYSQRNTFGHFVRSESKWKGYFWNKKAAIWVLKIQLKEQRKEEKGWQIMKLQPRQAGLREGTSCGLYKGQRERERENLLSSSWKDLCLIDWSYQCFYLEQDCRLKHLGQFL